jgi:hypothetical protein
MLGTVICDRAKDGISDTHFAREVGLSVSCPMTVW